MICILRVVQFHRFKTNYIWMGAYKIGSGWQFTTYLALISPKLARKQPQKIVFYLPLQWCGVCMGP